MNLRGLSARTVRSYLGWASQLGRHYPEQELADLSRAEVLDFFVHLQSDRKLAGSSVNQALCALRCFYRDFLKRRWKVWNEVKIYREEPLPEVLTREEVSLLLDTFHNGLYRAYFTLVYQCGLRLSEALNVRPSDIQSQRLTIRVKGKGGKLREVPISPDLLMRLRVFWRFHRNPDWLFPATGRGWKSSGRTRQQALHASSKPMSKASAWAAFKQAKTECGLFRKHPKMCIHTLRHSYATHLLEGGVHIRQLSTYLGHTTLKPTLVYLHLTEVSDAQAREALRTLVFPSDKKKP